MNTPITIWNELKDNYLRYLRTGIPLNHPKLDEERAELFNKSADLESGFWHHPFFELMPSYPSGAMLAELEFLPKGFAHFASLGLFSPSRLYRHQEAALLAVDRDRKHIVVTTGTGSGKTESFLLPMLASIIQEAENEWKQPVAYTPNRWWNANDGNPLLMQDIFEFPQGAEQGTPGYLASSAMQRSNEKRDAAVRALIIYPMNALVEDQMTRLRDALDNDEPRRCWSWW